MADSADTFQLEKRFFRQFKRNLQEIESEMVQMLSTEAGAPSSAVPPKMTARVTKRKKN